MAILTTLREARRAIMSDLGELDIFVATDDSTGPDAARTIMCADLIDDEIADSAFGSGFLYCSGGANLGQQRRTRRVAIDGTTGSLITTAPWSSPPLTGDEFEFSKKMPMIRHMGHQGIREAINAGLAYWNIEDRIQMTGVSQQYSYPLDQLPFMGDEARVLGVRDTAWTGTGMPMQPTQWAWELRHDYEVPQIDFCGIAPYADGQPWELRVWRAASTRIYDGITDTWVDSTAGLVNDDDGARVELGVMVELGLWKAYGFLAASEGSGSGGTVELRRLEAMHGAICQALKRDRAAELGGWPVRPEAVTSSVWGKNWSP